MDLKRKQFDDRMSNYNQELVLVMKQHGLLLAEEEKLVADYLRATA